MPPAGIRRDWYVNTTIPPDEGIELIDGEDGNIEELQRELQMIANSEEEIILKYSGLSLIRTLRGEFEFVQIMESSN